MKPLITLALAATAGYWLVWKAAPAVQARIEAFDLDGKWADFLDVFPEGDEAW